MLELIGIGGQLHIEVRHVQLEPMDDYGTMQWSVAIHSHDLSGKYDDIYVWPTYYEQFLRDLTNLEQHRTGKASLTSIYPEELQLTFQNLDNLGQMMVEGQIGDYTYIGDRLYIQKMNFAFQFDPSLLPDLVKQFMAFRTWAK